MENKVVSGTGALASLFSAGFWLWASVVPVPDNLDTFIDALQHIAQLNAFAAGSAVVAALCATILFARQFYQRRADQLGRNT